MTSPFSLLAVELVEEIVTHLDFHDIASFRLTCRDLERKASYGSFTQHFKTTNIDLTWDALQTFVDLTRHGRLGTHLQCCTISGIARNHEILHAERAEQLYLLTQAFDSLKRYSPRKSLASLSLRVSPDPRNGWENLPRDLNPLLSWRMVWKAAMNTFTLTMAALNTAGLAVDEEMNVFGTVKGCSLTSDTFFSFTQTPVFARTFWSMKTLTLSLSAPLQAFVRHSLEAETQSQMQTRYSGLALQDVARTLRSLPLLQVLEVHWYRIDRILEASRIAYSAEPHNQTATSDRDGLPQLARCTLRGLYLTSHHLLSLSLIHI